MLDPEIFMRAEHRIARRDGAGTGEPTVLRIDQLRRMLDVLEQVVYCHPSDASQPLVTQLAGAGYRIVTRQSQKPGRAFLKNAAKLALVDFAAGEAYVTDNTMLAWAS